MRRDAGYIARNNRTIKDMANKAIRTTFDVISSISSNGKRLNAKNSSSSEVRDVRIINQYGISSSGIDGIMVQIITNDNNSDNAIGVYDSNKPDVLPGEVIIYSHYGATMKMLSDGEIVLTNGDGKSVTLTELYNHINP